MSIRVSKFAEVAGPGSYPRDDVNNVVAMTRAKRLFVACATLFLICITVVLAAAQLDSTDPELQHLRNELAMRWLEPEPHMELAKFIYDRGDRLLAFYILENIRRTRFPMEVFDQAFDQVFRGQGPFDNSQEAEAAAKHAVEAVPDDPEALVHLADIYISREEYTAAAPLLERAVVLQPDDAGTWFALTETYRRQGRNEAATRNMERFAETHPGSPEVVLQETAALMESNPAEARRRLQQAAEAHPESGAILFNLAVATQEGGDLEEAEQLFKEAAQLAPNDAHIQGWTGRFLLKVADDPEGALQSYLNAYFLDPHFYETEFAESRIRTLAWEAAEQTTEQILRQGASVETLLQHPNPVVAGMGLDRAKENWTPAYVEPVVELMTDDDPGLRWGATVALMENVDEKFDERLAQLLVDSDLRRRGLAAYLAVHRWGQDAFPTLENFLQSEAQLLRYDAISAILQDGGEAGKTLLRNYREHETNPLLREIIDVYAVAE